MVEIIKTMVSNKFEDIQKELYADAKNVQNKTELIVFQNETLSKLQKIIPFVYGKYENITFSEQNEITDFSIQKLNSLHQKYIELTHKIISKI